MAGVGMQRCPGIMGRAREFGSVEKAMGDSGSSAALGHLT